MEVGRLVAVGTLEVGKLWVLADSSPVAAAGVATGTVDMGDAAVGRADIEAAVAGTAWAVSAVDMGLPVWLQIQAELPDDKVAVEWPSAVGKPDSVEWAVVEHSSEYRALAAMGQQVFEHCCS